MKILNTAQIREWDQFTIQHEPIASIDLMERAAQCCVNWLQQNGYNACPVEIFCGKGNNGGDGLAIARLLTMEGNSVAVHILAPDDPAHQHKGTIDFQINLERLHQYPEVEISYVQSTQHFHSIPESHIIIDALLGSGINRPVEGLTEALIQFIKQSGAEIISIDIPSGLYVDHSSAGNTTIQASHTLGFQCYKPGYLVAENEKAIGDVHILDIGLSTVYLNTITPVAELTELSLIKSIYKPRNRFAHKGNFGHALLMAGSMGKMGAAVLAAKACLRSGVGLLSCQVPKCGYTIIQSTVPEAMAIVDVNENIMSKLPDDIDRYAAIGIGPGMGTESATAALLKSVLESFSKPMVVDADALNLLAENKNCWQSVPANSILTPHPKEFDRLFGKSTNDFERIEIAKEQAVALNCIIILKGHHSYIATPSGQCYFNSTGNAGMAKGGSGDVLTGILTALLAQGYEPAKAAVLGVYLHGLAGDFAAKSFSQEAMLPGDLIHSLPEAFLSISEA